MSLPALAAFTCFAQLTSEQLLQRGKDRASYTNDYNGAIADFTLVIDAKYHLAEAYTERGWAYSRKTNYDEALLDYQKSIQADPAYWMAYEHRASTKRKIGDFTGCIEDCQKAVQVSPTNTVPLFGFGMVYELLTNWDGAIDCYSRIIKLEPSKESGYFCRASAEYWKGNWQAALADMNEAIRLDRPQPGANRVLDRSDRYLKSYHFAFRGWIEVQLRQYNSATVDAARAMGYGSTNGFAYSTRAWARFGRNDISGAIEDCKTAVKFAEEDEETRLRAQGLLCFITGDQKNAITAWKRAIELSRQRDLAALQPWIIKATELSKTNLPAQNDIPTK